MPAIQQPTTITTAVSAVVSAPIFFRDGAPKNLTLEAEFTYGSGGTTADVWVQTTFDGGLTWVDIANFHFTTSSLNSIFNLSASTPITTVYTPTDGTLAANTCKDGLIGAALRTKMTTVGTYAGGTKVAIYANSSRMQT